MIEELAHLILHHWRSSPEKSCLTLDTLYRGHRVRIDFSTYHEQEQFYRINLTLSHGCRKVEQALSCGTFSLVDEELRLVAQAEELKARMDDLVERLEDF